MLDPARLAALPAAPAPITAKPRAVFRMIENDRMGGSVPAWVQPGSAQDASLAALSGAATGESSTALPYRPDSNADASGKPFGFGDIVDIVNPLQHLPVIGSVYRNITGDDIRPSSQIIGGAVFGGAIGAAGSLANVIIREETGDDLAGHAVRIAMGNPAPAAEQVAERLANAETPDPLPGSALSFVDLSHREAPAKPVRNGAVYKFNE